MKAEKENLPNSRVKFTITIEPDEFKKYLDRAFTRLSTETKIPGFRPGKAPRDLTEAEIGQDKLFSEALDLALPETWAAVITESKLIPLHQPEIKITKLAPGNPLIFQAEVDVLPKFDLPDYQKIKLKAVETKKISDQDVDEVLSNLQKSYTDFKKVSRPAKKGDKIEIDYDGSIRGAKIDQLSSKNHPMILGETKLIPGFEDELVGLKAGDTKEFELSLPKELPDKLIAGLKAKFKVKMLEVQERKLPEINDQFAQKISKLKNLKAMKQDIKKSLEARAKRDAKNETEKQVIEQILAETDFEVPESLVKQETNQMFNDFVADIEGRGIKFTDYLAKIGKTKEDLEKQMREQAEKRIRISLLIAEIKQQEKITISDAEIEKEVSRVQKSGQAIKDEAAFRRYVKSVLGNQKVLDKLVDYCVMGN